MQPGSKDPGCAFSGKRTPVHAEFVSMVTHWLEPLVLVNVYES